MKLFILQMNMLLLSEKRLVLWFSNINTHTHIFSGLKNCAHFFQSHQMHMLNIVGRSNTTLCSSVLTSRAIILKLVFVAWNMDLGAVNLKGRRRGRFLVSFMARRSTSGFHIMRLRYHKRAFCVFPIHYK